MSDNALMDYYQPFFSPDGERLHQLDTWQILRYWNDACWHRSIPQYADGLTYLDVGANKGYYCLRFEQRGGLARGLDFDSTCGHVVNTEEEALAYPTIGQESGDPHYLDIKRMYGAAFMVTGGGFAGTKIIPGQQAADIVSCMNVLEYMLDPRGCIASLFAAAKERVILALDIDPTGPTRRATNWPMRTLTGKADLESWLPWPSVSWLYDVGTDVDSDSRYQLFVTATRPGSKLPPVDPGELSFNTDLPETERWWRATC